MSSFKSPSNALPQRSSPFRRPASPASPSAGRPNTPPSTSRTAASPMTSPSKLKQSYTVSEEEEEESFLATPTKSAHVAVTTDFRASTTSSLNLNPDSPQSVRHLPSPPKQPQSFALGSMSMGSHVDPLTRLPPPLLHSLRESFSVLDPSSTGHITPSSVHETLQSLGLDTSAINQLFPPGSAQSLTLPQYLSQLANILIDLSPQQELLNAFSAFDDDDSGQVDVAELKRALMITPPDAGEPALTEKDIDRALEGFTGRRILGRNTMGVSGVKGLSTPAGSRKAGDVFRYQEFVGNLMGTNMDQQMGQSVRAG